MDALIVRRNDHQPRILCLQLVQQHQHQLQQQLVDHRVLVTLLSWGLDQMSSLVVKQPRLL